MISDNPYFSIVVPTYNRAHLICKTLDSFVGQGYKDFEVIIVDDGSTDNTEDVVKPYLADLRFRYYRKSNSERAAARNFGVLKSSGEFVTFIDSDDLVYPNYLSHALELINQNPDDAFFHTAYNISTTNGNIVKVLNKRKGNLNHHLLKGNILSCIGVFIKRKVLLDFRFNENRALSGSEDWELWMRIGAVYKIVYSNEITASLIQHPDRSVINSNYKALIRRINLAAECVFNDNKIKEVHGDKFRLVFSHLMIYLSLHLALINQGKKSIYFLKIAIQKNPLIIFDRKFISVILKLIY